MIVEFETREYRISHMREPRGRGYWAFQVPGESEPRWVQGTYSEAKKAITAALKAQFFSDTFKWSRVTVMVLS